MVTPWQPGALAHTRGYNARRLTPVMAARITKRPCEMSDVVHVFEAWEAQR